MYSERIPAFPYEHEDEDWFAGESETLEVTQPETSPEFSRVPRVLYEFEKFEKMWRPRPDEELERTFRNLKRNWETQTLHLSSPTAKFQNIYYQQIIGLGSSVIPLLLKDMQDDDNLWFWALYMISRENPVENEHVGDIDEMTADWLRWGRLKGYI